MSERIRVLIVDDDDLMRAGLRGVLASDDAIELVGEANDGREATYRVRLLNPDVVLMDVRMPDLDGISATRELTAAYPEVKVVILTTFEQDDYIFGALNAGASGFLLKRTRPEDLIAAIHTIAAGDSLLSPSVTSRVVERMAGQPQPDAVRDARLEELTPRETQVLELVARGRSNAEISADARHRGVDREDPREAHPREARRARQGAGGDLRLRERNDPPGRRRLTPVCAAGPEGGQSLAGTCAEHA